MQNLSIIIPVYNEKKTISKVLYKVRKLTIRGVTIETVIVDDCS
ncbi:glycosyltransferase, partial [Candidatus Woesearchaeota archaeon]|nr:glycosyltransferase [Candidatus Woesearchaeota archaeon]